MDDAKAKLILKNGLAMRPSDSGVGAAAGKFAYYSLRDGRIKFTDDWARKNITYLSTSDALLGWPKLPTATGYVRVSRVAIHKKLKNILEATWFMVRRENAHLKLREFNGVFMPRHRLWNPKNPLSIHSWGWAIDFDARFNGYGVDPVIDMNFVRIFESCGWHWGGRWGTPDGMHFQFTDPVEGSKIPKHQDSLCK